MARIARMETGYPWKSIVHPRNVGFLTACWPTEMLDGMELYLKDAVILNGKELFVNCVPHVDIAHQRHQAYAWRTGGTQRDGGGTTI